VGAQLTEHVCIQSNDKAYSFVANQTYQVVARFRFRGTAIMGVPTAMLANFWSPPVPGGFVDCRIVDATNGNLVICMATTNGTNPAQFIDLGVLSNLPAAPATFEVQIKTNGPGQCRIGAVAIEY
jgi:hypothetical protein